jgi:two-component system cell cycle response regulator DivK
MKAENNQTGGSGSFGTLLSLFGRKLKSGGEKPVVSIEAAPGGSEVSLSLFAKGRRILIADDDAVFCQATENKLRMSGFEVCRATEGSSVIQAARSQAPDVILLDLEFPAELPTSWDGFSIMDWLNQMNWFPNTPIIICTGSNAPDLTKRANVARAAGVLHKPLDYGQLLGLIEGQLASRGSGNN